VDATTKDLLWVQTRGLATKSCPPNIKQLDYPPTKKTRTAQAAPEFHIAVNLAPNPGAGVPALQGTCIVSDSQIRRPASPAAPGPLRLEEVADLKRPREPRSEADPRPLGRRVWIPKVRRAILQSLSDCAKTGRVPSSYDILTWMDIEHPEVDEPYLDSYSDFQNFGIEDAFDIMEHEVCYLATFGHLGRGGAQRLRQYTRDKILIPLNLWDTKTESCDSGIPMLGPTEVQRIFMWRKDVEPGYEEDIKDIKEEAEEVVMEEVVMEEVGGGESSDIEEISGFDWRAANVGKFEEDLEEEI
jgi:hypothetical protein